jgi:hypothetical protein
MKSHNAMRDEEAIDAGWEATRGAVIGAIKWGAVTAVLGGIGYAASPLYRSLTIQFKVYVYPWDDPPSLESWMLNRHIHLVISRCPAWSSAA